MDKNPVKNQQNWLEKSTRYQKFLKQRNFFDNDFKNDDRRFIKNRKNFAFDLQILTIKQNNFSRSLVVDFITNEDLDMYIILHDIGEVTVHSFHTHDQLFIIN